MKNLIVPVVAMVCIAAMQIYAMSQGHDGLILVTCIAVIAGIAGYKMPSLLEQIKNKSKSSDSDQTRKG